MGKMLSDEELSWILRQQRIARFLLLFHAAVEGLVQNVNLICLPYSV